MDASLLAFVTYPRPQVPGWDNKGSTLLIEVLLDALLDPN